MQVVGTTCVRATRNRRHEGAFSLVEIVIAAVLLAVIIGGATAMFASSSRTQSFTRVKDKQTALSDKVLGTLQADTAWATWCRQRQPRFNPASPNCDLTQWMLLQPQYANIGIVDEGGERYVFRVGAIAQGFDLASDGRDAADSDGVLPDMYRLRITIAPDSSLRNRFSGLKPVTVQTEANPSGRVVTGRLAIDACVVLNQIDERSAVGDCTVGGSSIPLLPPTLLRASDPSSCPSSFTTRIAVGTRGRDCHSYRCAHTQLRSDPACGGALFARFPTTPADDAYTTSQVQAAPGNGHPLGRQLAVRNVDSGRVWRAWLVNGHADFNDLPVGKYDIIHSISGYEFWKSKSVPSSTTVTVEAGMKSRAVLMYRPASNAQVIIRVRTIDGSREPWNQRPLPGLQYIDENGNPKVVNNIVFRLVPVPMGRLPESDWPEVVIPASGPGVTTIHWRDVPSGLYSFQFTDRGHRKFNSISGTAGFIYLPPGGVYADYGTAPPIEFVNGVCAVNVRAPLVGSRPVNPYTGRPLAQPLQACNAGGGGGSGGGGGGSSQS